MLTLFIVPRSSQCILESARGERWSSLVVINWVWDLFGPVRRTGDGELVEIAFRCAACKMDSANGPGDIQLGSIKVIRRCISLLPAYLVIVIHSVIAGGCQTLYTAHVPVTLRVRENMAVDRTKRRRICERDEAGT